MEAENETQDTNRTDGLSELRKEIIEHDQSEEGKSVDEIKSEFGIDVMMPELHAMWKSPPRPYVRKSNPRIDPLANTPGIKSIKKQLFIHRIVQWLLKFGVLKNADNES